MIFDSLRDRLTVSIDIPKSRKRSKQTAKRSKPAPEPRKRTATPQTRRTDTETKRVAPRSRPANPRSTPTADTRTYRSTTGGLFYATGRDGRPQGYPRLSGVETPKKGHTFFYWIDADERGEFSARVNNPHGKEVFSIPDAEAMEDLIQDGFMRNTGDIDGLAEYLKDMGVMAKNDVLVESNWYMQDEADEEDEEDDEEDGSLADSLADLAGISENELYVADQINKRLEAIDHITKIPIRVFCTKSKNNPYIVRRFVPDCNSKSATKRGGFNGILSTHKQIGMGPKSRAKYIPKHLGVTWEEITDLETNDYELRAKISKHLKMLSTENEEKITAVSTRRAQREERIAEVRREREARQAAQAERIAKRREEREAKRKPVVEVAPQPKPVETVTPPKPKTERKPRKPKVKPEPNAESVQSATVAPVVPAQNANASLTTAQMDSIESDMQNLIALLQAAKKS